MFKQRLELASKLHKIDAQVFLVPLVIKQNNSPIRIKNSMACIMMAMTYMIYKNEHIETSMIKSFPYSALLHMQGT